jgi:hypothetical protein
MRSRNQFEEAVEQKYLSMMRIMKPRLPWLIPLALAVVSWCIYIEPLFWLLSLAPVIGTCWVLRADILATRNRFPEAMKGPAGIYAILGTLLFIAIVPVAMHFTYH